MYFNLKIMLKINDLAPDFELPYNPDEFVKLSDFKGEKHVVLYFYPKDSTPGCTQEACDFRDSLNAFNALDVVVLGVSRDGLKSHDKFSQKYQLNFPLLADPDGEVCEPYGCWKEKSMFGKKYMGIERSTFLIDKTGTIKNVWRKVKVTGHIDEVLKAAKSL